MSTPKRWRQRANRQARLDAKQAIRPVTDSDLERLLSDVTVREDCQHARTRANADGVVLIRCVMEASVRGGCPPDCARFEKRRAGGLGL